MLVDTTNLALTRFANSMIHQNVADETTTVRLVAHVDGRTVTATTTVTGDDALRGFVDRTLDAARLAPLDPGWPGLAPAAKLATAGHRRRCDRQRVAGRPRRSDSRVRRRGRWPDDGGLLPHPARAGGICQLGRPGRVRRDRGDRDGRHRPNGVERRIGSARERLSLRRRRRETRCPGGCQGPGRRRRDRVAAGTIRSGARTDRGGRRSPGAGDVRLRREGSQRASVVPRRR